MTVYMEPRESVRYWFGEDERRILEVLSGRYVGANPRVPFALRAFAKSGVLQNREGLYDMNLSGKLPDAKNGDYAYVYGLVWSDDERSIDGIMDPFGPVRLYVNEDQVYRSNAVDEMKLDARVVIPLLFRKGWNAVLIEARKTEAGFGCRFGAEEAKVRILQVLAPFTGRAGIAGWVYAGPVKASVFGGGGMFPDYSLPEEKSGLTWQPRTSWTAEEAELPNFERLFGRPAQPAAALGWTGLSVPAAVETLILEGHALGPTTIWLNGQTAVELEEAGSFRTAVPVSPGIRQLLVRSVSGPSGWGLELCAFAGAKPLAFELPVAVHGSGGAWLYAGPLDSADKHDPSSVCTTARCFLP